MHVHIANTDLHTWTYCSTYTGGLYLSIYTYKYIYIYIDRYMYIYIYIIHTKMHIRVEKQWKTFRNIFAHEPLARGQWVVQRGSVRGLPVDHWDDRLAGALGAGCLCLYHYSNKDSSDKSKECITICNDSIHTYIYIIYIIIIVLSGKTWVKCVCTYLNLT